MRVQGFKCCAARFVNRAYNMVVGAALPLVASQRKVVVPFDSVAIVRYATGNA